MRSYALKLAIFVHH